MKIILVALVIEKVRVAIGQSPLGIAAPLTTEYGSTAEQYGFVTGNLESTAGNRHVVEATGTYVW